MGVKDKSVASDQAKRIITKFGGRTAFAKALTAFSGEVIRPSTVARWEEGDGFIPQRYHQLVYDAARAAGVPVSPEDFVAVMLTDAGQR